MPDTQGPLFSLAAHGSVADSLTYQGNGSRKQVRVKPTPTNPSSSAQLAIRGIQRYLNTFWRDAHENMKAPFDTAALRKMYSGYNHFLSSNIGRLAGVSDLSTLQTAAPDGYGLEPISITAFMFVIFPAAAITWPPAPSGWTGVRAHFYCVHDVDPRFHEPEDSYYTSIAYPGAQTTFNPSNLVPPFQVTAWLEWQRPGGQTVWSPSVIDNIPP